MTARALPIAALALAVAIAVAAAPTNNGGDPGLDHDSRYSRIAAHAQRGTGTDRGVYLSPIAGPQSEITGTVLSRNGAGPSDFVVATVSQSGEQTYYHGRTDESGHFHLRLPAIAGVVALLLFREFDDRGHPDEGATCRIAGAAAHLENARALANLPASGPAIVEGSTAYDLGGNGQGLVPLHVRGIDPLRTHLLLDGRSDGVQTLATSDESVLGQVHPGTLLGRHAISLDSNGRRSNALLSDVVRERFAPIGMMRPGEVTRVQLFIDGLGNDSATVTFTVGGAASLADGRASDTQPVRDGSAQTEIRGTHPGALLVNTVLDVAIAQNVAQELAHTQERTPSPPPLHAPEETPPVSVAHVPATRPPIYGHENELVPCRYHVSDGYMEVTQGFWQDDLNFVFPHVLERYRDRDYPAYGAEYALAANRPAVIAGVYHYQWLPDKTDDYPRDREHVMLSIESNCDPHQAEPVRIEFAYYLNGGEAWSGVPSQRWRVPLRGMVRRNAEYVEYVLNVPAEFGWPAESAAFTPSAAGHYTIFARLQHHESSSPSSPWVDVPGVYMTLNGEVQQTHGLTIHYVPLMITPGGDGAALVTAANEISNRVAIDLPDLYPLPPSGGNAAASALPGTVDLDANGNAWDLSSDDRITHPENHLSKEIRDILGPDLHLLNFPPGPAEYESAVMELLSNTLGLQAILEKGDRVVAVVSSDDFRRLNTSAAAYTNQKKVIFVKTSSSYETVGHELAHTLPWDWSQEPGVPDSDRTTWMLSECHIGYHNVSRDYAQGLRFIIHGKVVGSGARRHENTYGIMAPAYANKYIEQCTSRHLTTEFGHGNNDPQVIVVRGYLVRGSSRIAAQFTPFYTLTSGLDDTRDDPAADLHLRLFGTGHALLREISIAPLFLRTDDPSTRLGKPTLIAFMSRIPYVDGVQSMELVSRHGGVLASKAFSATPPNVVVGQPASIASNGLVTLRWRIASPARELLSSVLDSMDGGRSYRALSVEQNGTALQARLIGYGTHLLRIVVSDGSRSGEATTRVTYPQP